MAVSFYLSDGTDTVNFITGSLELRAGGWNTESFDDEFIWETIELISDITDSTVRSEKKKLDALLHRARLYAKNSLSSDAVWLYWNADGETAKRSLVLDGSTEILSDEIYSPLMGIDSIKVAVALKRMPFWENTSYTTVNKTSLSVTGGIASIANDAGTLNQRIEAAFIVAKTVAKNKFWIGIRPYYGAPGGGEFEPLWECEDGTNYIDASDVADGGASGGNKVQISFATATLAKRFSVTVDDVIGIGDHRDFVGKYLVLARCKVNAGSTQVRIQLRSGFFYLVDTETVVQDTIIDGQTGWNLVELGEVQFPPMGNRDGRADEQIEFASLTIWAERLSVAGTLDMDALILIPSEHLFKCSATGLVIDGGPEAYVTPIDDNYAVGNSAGYWGNLDFNMSNWEYPLGGGIIVTAAEDNTHTLTGTLNVTLYLVPRWQSYRA